jgi:SAM-dependent methyltransferase
VIEAVPLAGASLGLAVARAFRWQFLLRRIGIRQPVRASVAAAVGSDALALATPWGLGALLRPWLMPRRQAPRLPLLLANVADIAFDLAGLFVLVGSRRGLLVSLGCIGVAVVAVLGARGFIATDARRQGGKAWALSFGVSALLWATAGSLIVWGSFFGLTALLTGQAWTGVPALTARLLGTLAGPVPLALAFWGGPTERLSSMVFLLVWVLAGGIAWRAALRFRRSAGTTDARAMLHFDEIAKEYLAQWPPHIWELLLRRRINHLCAAIGAPHQAGRGLDLGCGLGLQALEMQQRGYAVLGLDPARNLLAYARERGLPVATGNALALPVADAKLGFVYALGVIHHLPDPGTQRAALDQAARTLQAGGRVVVQETNPQNPLFRFYMGYLFPLLKVIDEGIEWWIRPSAWPLGAPLEVERVRYFTFLPDFLPQWLLGIAQPLERWLERSPLRSYSVHYMVVLQRPATATSANEASGQG